MNQETPYIEETIKVIRPTNSNRIFNEQEYDIVQTQDTDGEKLVILRIKQSTDEKNKL